MSRKKGKTNQKKDLLNKINKAHKKWLKTKEDKYKADKEQLKAKVRSYYK